MTKKEISVVKTRKRRGSGRAVSVMQAAWSDRSVTYGVPTKRLAWLVALTLSIAACGSNTENIDPGTAGASNAGAGNAGAGGSGSAQGGSAGAADSTGDAGSDTSGHAFAGGCTYDVERPLQLDDATALGMTLGQIGEHFDIGKPWVCDLNWGHLDDRAAATWSPHDSTSKTSVALDWGTGATEFSRGHGPPGSRLECPSHVSIDLAVALESEDGGFNEHWHLATDLFDTSSLGIKSELRALGLYHFDGTYEFNWLMPEPHLFSNFEFVIDESGASPQVEGGLMEASQYDVVDDAGNGSGAGEAIISAALTCSGH